MVTQSAQAIGAGNLDQVVPVLGSDELGQLAQAAVEGFPRGLGREQLRQPAEVIAIALERFEGQVQGQGPGGNVTQATRQGCDAPSACVRAPTLVLRSRG